MRLHPDTPAIASAGGPATRAGTPGRPVLAGGARSPAGLLATLVRAVAARRDAARGRRAIARLGPRLRRDVGLPDDPAGAALDELRAAELRWRLGARIGPRPGSFRPPR